MFAHTTSLREIKRHPKASFVFGVVALGLGAAAVLFPFAATLTAELIIGAILFVAGIFKTIGSFARWRGRRFAFEFASGLLAIAVGGWLLLFPVPGILSLTLVVAAFLVADGVLRIVGALRKPAEKGWVWLCASGALALVLGVFIFLQWPYAATWLLGLLVGIDLLATGAHQLWISRSPVHAATGRDP